MKDLDQPIKFAPYYKSVIWGGDKISKFKGIDIDCPSLGESWEISAIPGHISVVNGGKWAGYSLEELIQIHGERLLGTEVVSRYGMRFPLLIKLIDAKKDLSVQVHPDDTLAMKRHNSAGKTEMWYVIDCDPGARIYSGFSVSLDKDGYCKRIADNTIMDVVASYESVPGQFYFIPAGTIHSIGAGNLIAEIQQSSDITYRVYDYGRKDSDGNFRQLHTQEAKDAIDYSASDKTFPVAKVLDGTKIGMVECQYFKVDYLSIKDGIEHVRNDGSTFIILMVTRGYADVVTGETTTRISRGETILIPASIMEFDIAAYGELLKVYI